MLNIVETMSVRPIVPLVPVSCLPENQDAPSSPSPTPAAACEPLAALLAHPEFQQGLALAQEVFLDEYEEAPLSEEEMMEQVETNLSQQATERDRASCRLFGDEPSSYFYGLGYVLGIINQGLGYVR